MIKQCQQISLQGPQRNRNATANFVNLIRTSTVAWRLTNLHNMCNVLKYGNPKRQNNSVRSRFGLLPVTINLHLVHMYCHKRTQGNIHVDESVSMDR